MRLLILLHVFYSIRIGHSLRVCTMKHYRINSGDVLQRVELSTAEKCVERCIENMMYCYVAQFSKSKNKVLGVCSLYAKTKKEMTLHPDATIDPLTIIYELVEKCAPFTSSEKFKADRREQKPKVVPEVEDRLADSFFPESDHVSGDDEFSVNNNRYAVMKVLEDEVEVEATNDAFPRDPFTDSPRYHEMSKEYKTSREESSPIRPIVMHRGLQLNSANSGRFGYPCPPNADCAKTLYQMDLSPCPARQGDPCAPRPPCLNDDCYHVAPPEAEGQIMPQWSEWSSCSASCGSSTKTRQCSGQLPHLINIPYLNALSGLLGLRGHFVQLLVAEVNSNELELARTAAIALDPAYRAIHCLAQYGLTGLRGPVASKRAAVGLNAVQELVRMDFFALGRQVKSDHVIEDRVRTGENGAAGASARKLVAEEKHIDQETVLTAIHVKEHPKKSYFVTNNLVQSGHSGLNGRFVKKKCGEETFRLRNRVCQYGTNGADCEGPAQDQSSCPVRECPKWSEWEEWSDCSTTCGQGSQKRLRKCVNGYECTGPANEMRFCQIASCPYWGEWSQWSGCSVSCGRGFCERNRKCITDEFLHIPSLDELEHDDSSSELRAEAKQALIARAKIVKNLNQSEASLSPSRNGFESSGGTCGGSSSEKKVCDAGPCCFWENWTEWSPCIGCGRDGITKRNRACNPEGYSSETFAPPFQVSFQEDFDRHPPAAAPLDQYTIPKSSEMTLIGLSPIIPIVHRGKRQSSYGLALRARPPQCHCPGESFDTKPCPNPLPCEDPTPSCEWSSWGEWCGCQRCREGQQIRRRYCDRVNTIRGGPMKPDLSCECPDGLDMEDRPCKVDNSCFRGLTAYNLDLSERGRQNSRENNRGFYSQSSSRQEENVDRYVPIDSVIGRVELNRKASENYDRKDSASIYTTTQYPYAMCQWSKWSPWSDCDSEFEMERKRFCVGDQADLVSNCECVGKSHEEQRCTQKPQKTSSQAEMSVETTEAEIESGLDELLKLTDESSPRATEISSSLTDLQCDWTRWSQWSVCTTTCGPGQRMRRRRCPCGENKCGAGVESSTEHCDSAPCTSSNQRNHPNFRIVSS
ncbi:unnamed protein product [Caenorhabditis auriculariae]|uniref:Apple domain-containing protein n=1 Tax=Caenorhabditis auriculariae TaxID=2777116 RepID=A0A8S1GQY0_9PELO|nr:unnamed protein product [Caenorhabditis auriculariae]